MKRRNAKHI